MPRKKTTGDSRLGAAREIAAVLKKFEWVDRALVLERAAEIVAEATPKVKRKGRAKAATTPTLNLKSQIAASKTAASKVRPPTKPTTTARPSVANASGRKPVSAADLAKD